MDREDHTEAISPLPVDHLRTRIAAAQREHRLTSFGANYVQCECGWKSPEKYATWTDHPEHVADAVIRELGLTRFDAPPEYWYATTIWTTADE